MMAAQTTTDESAVRERGDIGRLVTAGTLWAVSVIFLIGSLQLHGVTQMVPLGAAALTVACATWVLGAELLHQRTTRSEPAGEIPTDRSPLGGEKKITSRSEPAAFAWIGAIFASYFLIGSVATLLFSILLFVKVYGRESWPRSIATAFGATVVVYIGFVQLLNMPTFWGYFPIL